jgi:cyclase
LLQGKRLVKGTAFDDFIDVGDPLSQALIYDAQGADEIMIVDIEAGKNGTTIDTKIIKQMIYNCRLPISVGGGIKTLEDARRCFESGADKIVVNTQAVCNPILVKELADEFGSQSVVVSLDVRKNNTDDYCVYIRSGKEKVDVSVFSIIEELLTYGVGEIMVTSIEKEGTLSGFDSVLYDSVRKMVSVPLIASGGAGSYDHIVDLFEETDCDACAIGKMLFLRDYDIVRIKSYLKGKKVAVRDA